MGEVLTPLATFLLGVGATWLQHRTAAKAAATEEIKSLWVENRALRDELGRLWSRIGELEKQLHELNGGVN